jgi:hypothetical protein
VKVTTRIFISYAREDEEKVEDLYQKLSDAGFKPWMDKKDILPGEKWKPCIQRAIRRSDFFLACLSANSVSKRGYLQKEIKDALDIWQEKLDSDIYLIPVRLEDCEVPESLRDFQWVNLFEKDGWPQLVRAIQIGMEHRAEVSADEEPPPDTETATPEESPEQAPKMDVQKHRQRQWREVVWHGIISNAAYDIIKRLLVALSFIIGPWLISLGQRALGAAIPSVRNALSTKVALTAGTISTIILWFPFGVILWFLFGFMFAGFVGFVSTRILWYWGRVRVSRKPQTTDIATEKIPWQVLIDGCKSPVTLIIIFFIIPCSVIGPWLISLGQRAQGAAIPAVGNALSTEVVFTVGTISTLILWLLFGIVIWFLSGFIFAGFVGFVSRQILWHWGMVTAIRRPPDMTPRQVLVGCKNLIILIFFFWVGICLFAAVSVFGWEKFIAFVRSVVQP